MSTDQDLSAAIAEVQLALERLRLAADRSASSQQGWDVIDPPAEAAPAETNLRGSSPQTPPRVAPRRTAPATASFATCPQYGLDLCACLAAAGSGLSAEERAKRAWVAGLGPKRCLKAWGTPLPSASVGLRPTIYIVLRCVDLPEPARFNSYASFRRAVGPLENTDTICHSFPSLAEARVYCYAAGVALPHLRQ